MRILVTGRDGQVARSLSEAAQGRSEEFVFVSRPQFDLASPETIRAAIREHAPDIIVSAAAYTAVDTAEDEPELARRINGEAPGILADEAARAGAWIIHLSTDYVYDGFGTRPWREEDPTGPASVYGQSKLQGEEAVREAAPNSHVILRTAWVYSAFGRNFLRSMLHLAETRSELRVVADQYGNPTWAGDIACGILAVVDHISASADDRLAGTYNLAGPEAMNWADFARMIFAESAALGGKRPEVVNISTVEYPTKACRPANSRLDGSAFAATFGFRTSPTRSNIEKVLSRIRKSDAAI
ncbi:dTDP-4-dehydrorhamnose reductase [Pseudohoeflea suaedae]|uniref:dTDP-4-dehydrorhamnose reductase n=1 Tax=Pseudohoeflea suaedae TaxID=877384 RepID=A0A4R5PNV7_9HYPH|nr:dTDP-4-dehydrorhamnose reductase [Pseudohoeflea suaedae]TDH38726.1 dTDP-4-dehydrorhamnose reductase [Pseudohoeflea suaedae]